jgi:prophage DNA circulation protein
LASLNPIGTLAQQPIDQSGSSWLGGAWFEQLQPGSWRAVPFVLDTAETRAGRRVSVHEYPYRDTVWPEDLGKLPRRFAFTAYLTGDDVYQQRDRMLAACEQAGVGTLVHPTLGSVQCVLLDFAVSDTRERGRYVEVRFAFVAYSAQLFPTGSTATGDNVSAAASALLQASGGDLSLFMNAAGTSVPGNLSSVVSNFSSLATNVVNDPTRALNAVTGLQGLFGRFSSGSSMTLLPATATVDSALSDSISTRQDVLDSGDALDAAFGDL